MVKIVPFLLIQLMGSYMFCFDLVANNSVPLILSSLCIFDKLATLKKSNEPTYNDQHDNNRKSTLGWLHKTHVLFVAFCNNIHDFFEIL